MSRIGNIRLKTAINSDQIKDRLDYQPEIIELHLTQENLHHPEQIIDTVHFLKSKGIRVYLHHPMKYNGQYLDIISSNKDIRTFYDWSSQLLAKICKQEKIKCIIHCHYLNSESSILTECNRKETRRRIEEILRYCDQSFLWEDTVQGIFSAQNPSLLSEIIQPLHLPLNIDISHSFISLHGDNQALKQHLENIHLYAKYFHLVDSFGIKHDSLPLGKGKIDWAMVKPYIRDKDFIFEIDLNDSNYLDCTPMIESAEYFEKVPVTTSSN